MRPQVEYVPWRERLFVTVDEAGEILGRSAAWVRSRIDEERLDGRRLAAGGPVVVSVPSLLAFAARAIPVLPRPNGRRLELVVNNDRK